MKWVYSKQREEYQNIEELINETIKSRFQMNEFYANMSNLVNPFKFKDMQAAVTKLTEHIKQGKNICIWGDYDVDGTTSAYMSYCTISMLVYYLKSTSKVGFYIPHREKEGYGVNSAALKTLKEKGYDIIITVDCGIANAKEVEYGKSIGLDFIVTDHHEYPSVVPDCPIINPHDGHYPFHKLSGCGTVFKFLLALYTYNGAPIGKVYEYLDIAAISTVADLMELVGENRIIVKFGLYQMQNNILKGERPWLNALLKEANFTGIVDSYTIGFVIGPRLNSIGRLSDAKATVMYMLEKDPEKLEKYAKRINELNEMRKEMQDDILKKSREYVENTGLSNAITIVAEGKAGVIGLAASNVVDRYYRPTTVFTSSYDPEVFKASARSIPDFDYFKEIIEANRDIIERGGGHAMAAGLAVKKDNIPLFNERVNAAVEKCLKEKPDLLERKLMVESELHATDITQDLVKKISQMEPFGQGNPKPVFSLKNANIVNLVGVPKDNPKHLQIEFEKDDVTFKGILFKKYDLLEEISEMNNLDLAFTLSLNSFRGLTSVQFIIEDYKQASI